MNNKQTRLGLSLGSQLSGHFEKGKPVELFATQLRDASMEQFLKHF
jgi:hypothetical protein